MSFGAPGQIVAVAFKHSESLQLDPKSLGKLKAMGCVLYSAAALALTRRRAFVAAEIQEGRAVYVGAGCRSASLKKSSWAAPLQSGPGLNRRQATEIYERAGVNDTGLMQRL